MNQKPTPLKLNVNTIRFNSKYDEDFNIIVTGRARDGKGIEYEVTLKFHNNYWLRKLSQGIKSIINDKIHSLNSAIQYLIDSK